MNALKNGQVDVWMGTQTEDEQILDKSAQIYKYIGWQY